MVHCGFEPSAVNHTFGSLGGMLATIKGMLSSYEDAEALAAVQAPRAAKPAGPLVRIESPSRIQRR